MIAPAKVKRQFRPAAWWETDPTRDPHRAAREDQQGLALLALVHFIANFLLVIAAAIPWPGEAAAESALFALLWTQACLAGIAIGFAREDFAGRVQLAGISCVYAAWVTSVAIKLADNMVWGWAWFTLALAATVALVAMSCAVVRSAKARLWQFVDSAELVAAGDLRMRWQFSLREAAGAIVVCSVFFMFLRWAREGSVASTVVVQFAFSALTTVVCLAATLAPGMPGFRMIVALAVTIGVGVLSAQPILRLPHALDVQFIPRTTALLPPLLVASLIVMRGTGYRLIPRKVTL